MLLIFRLTFATSGHFPFETKITVMIAVELIDQTEADATEASDLFIHQLVVIIPSLKAFARKLCGNGDLAEDLVQETILRALGARDSFTPGTNFRGWICTILRNHFYTSSRRGARLISWDPQAAERILIQEPSQQHAIHMLDVEKALGRLPTEQREILILVGANGATYEEAAEIVGCAIGTVKSRLARGRLALAAILDGPNEALTLGFTTDFNAML